MNRIDFRPKDSPLYELINDEWDIRWNDAIR